MPLLIFILVPLVELAIFMKVGAAIGIGWTLLLIIITAIIGVRLLKQQGLSTLLKAQQRMAQGELPAHELAEGFLLALAGALLLTPGFLTDSIGFALLLPGVRQRFVRHVLSLMQSRAGQASFTVYGQHSQRHRSSDQGDIIEGEWREESDNVQIDQKK